MSDKLKVILDISDELQELLELHQVDLYQAVQEELPEAELAYMSDPEAPSGSRDITAVILATAALITALTPVIKRILNQFKPDTTEIRIEEKVTHDANGKPVQERIYIYTQKEYNRSAPLERIPDKLQLPEPGNTLGASSGHGKEDGTSSTQEQH